MSEQTLTDRDITAIAEMISCSGKNGDHCDMHADNSVKLNANSEKLGSLGSSFMTLKWVVGLCMPLLILGMSFFWSTVDGNTKAAADRAREISIDVKDIKALVQSSLVDNAKTNTRLDAIEEDVRELKGRRGKQ